MSVSDSDEFLSAEEDNSLTALPLFTQPNDVTLAERKPLVDNLVTDDIQGMLPVESIRNSVNIDLSQMELTVPETPDELPLESCHITSDGRVPTIESSTTTNIPNYTGSVTDTGTGNTSDFTGIIPEYTHNIPDETEVIPDTTEDIPDDTGDILPGSGTEDSKDESIPPADDVRSVSDPVELEAVRLEVLAGKDTGNSLFRNGDLTSALDSYSSTLMLCPRELPSERAVLYSNRAICNLRLGQDQLALSDWTHSIETDPLYRKARLKRAQLYENLGKLEEALEDFSELLKSDPSCPEARAAVPRLTAEVETQREALKTEALSKLRDLGDMVLKPFGVSTSDFNFVQDPNTGSYSVSFGKKS